MPSKTSTQITDFLADFGEAWILKQQGANNQIDRRKAITQARENVSAIPAEKSQWLLDHLRNSIASELANSQPYEKQLRLQLTAYAIIHYLRDKVGTPATVAILGMRNEEFTRICNGGTIH